MRKVEKGWEWTEKSRGMKRDKREGRREEGGKRKEKMKMGKQHFYPTTVVFQVESSSLILKITLEIIHMTELHSSVGHE